MKGDHLGMKKLFNTMRKKISAAIVVAVALVACVTTILYASSSPTGGVPMANKPNPPVYSSSIKPAPAPTGDTGLASKYVNDQGLVNDPNVLIFDDFSDYTQMSDHISGDVSSGKRWNAYGLQNIMIDTTSGVAFTGPGCLQMTLPPTQLQFLKMTQSFGSGLPATILRDSE